MKLQKKQKYSNFRLSSTAVALLMGLMICGCTTKAIDNLPVNEHESVKTEAAIIELSPTPTASPTIFLTPSPTPTPSSTPGLSREEEIELLEIDNPNEIYKIREIWALVYSVDNHYKLTPAYCTYDTRDEGFYFTSFWDRTKLFFFDMKEEKRSINFIYHLDVCSPANPTLDGAQIVRFNGIFMWKTELDDLDIPIGDSVYSEYVDKAWTDQDVALTKLEIANWYLDVVPSEFRVMTSDLHQELAVEETTKVKAYN